MNLFWSDYVLRAYSHVIRIQVTLSQFHSFTRVSVPSRAVTAFFSFVTMCMFSVTSVRLGTGCRHSDGDQYRYLWLCTSGQFELFLHITRTTASGRYEVPIMNDNPPADRERYFPALTYHDCTAVLARPTCPRPILPIITPINQSSRRARYVRQIKPIRNGSVPGRESYCYNTNHGFFVS